MTGKRNIEIKARYKKHNYARKLLREREAEKIGLDHQIDTYFKIDKGKLKVREANIEEEKGLVYYDRETKKEPKTSKVTNCELGNPEEVKEVLKSSLEVEAVVDKEREIHWIENVKVHLDKVKELGKFIEFELMRDREGAYSSKQDLEKLMDEFKVNREDLIDESYSDMV